MMSIKAIKTLDVKGATCPIPVLKTKRALDEIQVGQVLEVVTTDIASKTDIPALLQRLGHELVELREDNEYIYFLIRKS